MSTSITHPKRRARVVTIVWGASILAVAVLVLLSQFVALSVDPVLLALGLLVSVGLSLVVGGILSLRTQTTAADHDNDPGTTRY